MTVATVDLAPLFEPIHLGGVAVRNRVVMTGHGTGMAHDHLPSDQHVAYYRERARGGVGLIGMAFPQIHPSSQNVPGEVQAYRPGIVPALRRVTDAVHEHGAKIVMQLGHTGRQSSSTWTDRPLWGPSNIPCPMNREMPKEMEPEDIDEIVEAHALGAANAKAGGMDGAEIHSGYGGYLLSSFLSPFSNERGDDYGGPTENRLRILLRVMDAVREAVGPDYLVGMNMQGDDFSPGGLDVAECVTMAATIAATGKVDYMVVKGATYYSASQNVPDMQHPRGGWVPLAAAVKAAVDVPVIAVGRLSRPADAAQVLTDGHADMVAMTRQHIADPETVRKLREGRIEDLRGCISCNQGCIDRLFKITHTSCVVNPAAGYEHVLGDLQPAGQPKRVLVIGGGPAGMKAAENAARRGHEVTLIERRERLGGQVLLAAALDGREDVGEAIRHLEVALDKLGVDVRVGQDLDAQGIEALGADEVVVATGSAPAREIIGNKSHGVREVPGLDHERVLDVVDVLERGAAVGARVLIVDDGEGQWKSHGLALHLAARGHHVHVSTPLPYVGAAIGPFSQNRLIPRLFEARIERHPFSVLLEVRDDVVVLRAEGREVELEVDTVVLAGWHRPQADLYFELKRRGARVTRIGDAVAARTMLEAMREGDRLGREL